MIVTYRSQVGNWNLRDRFKKGVLGGQPASKKPPESHMEGPLGRLYTALVHNGVMKLAEKVVRQSVSLPPRLAKQVGSMAKNRKLSKNRMLLELIENGIDAEKRKQEQFFALAERFRNEQDPEAANRLGDELGRMAFGG
ncbi:MAG: hypothetical protein WBW33_18970 [Bryobacteraceae bacterium]